MPKRPGENLARTEDGATYNKLQRPDKWPKEPARGLPQDVEDDSEPEALSNTSSDDEVEEGKKSRSRNKQRVHHRKARYTENGCLPMDDDEFSGSEGNDVSFAAIQYLKSVR
jgi:hypothetical protein